MPPDEDVALSAAFAKIRAHKWPVLGLAALLAGAGALYTWRKAPTWQARSTLLLVVPDPTRNPLALSLGVTQTSPLGVLQGVVKSRSGIDYVRKRTGIDREDLERWLEVQTDPTANQITIGATNKDKAMAIRMVATAIEGLTVLNRDVGFSTAQTQVRYLEGTIRERERELDQKQRAFVAFQRTLSVPIDPTKPETAGIPAQQLSQARFELGSIEKSLRVARAAASASAATLPRVPTTVPSINGWRTRLVQQEYDLRVLGIQLGPEAPDVVAKIQQIAITRKALQDETQRYLQSVTSNVDPRIAELEARRLVVADQVERLKPLAAKAPVEAVRLVQLYREATGAAAIVQTLREQYERARTEAQVDKVRWSVLDAPYLEDRPNNKNYWRNGALGAFVGLGLGSFWALRRKPRVS